MDKIWLIKRLNILLFIGFVLSIPTQVLLIGTMFPFVVSMLLVLLLVIVLGGRTPSIRRYAICLFVSLILVFGLALAGFYGPNTHGYPADTGLTWVSDKSLGTALSGVLLSPNIFISALLGYDCNSTYGPNCSDTTWFVGTLLAYGILVFGIILGSILAKKPNDLKRVTK